MLQSKETGKSGMLKPWLVLFFVAAPLTNWNGSDAGIPFLAAVFTRSPGRSKLNYSSSREQTRKRGGPRIFSSVSAFSVNVEAEEPASFELAPAHPTIETQCVFQRKQILLFTRACCMIMVRAHLAAFRKWFCAANGNIVRC
jgi:hypothetical protein